MPNIMKPLKTRKVNIRLEVEPKYTTIRDYQDE